MSYLYVYIKPFLLLSILFVKGEQLFSQSYRLFADTSKVNKGYIVIDSNTHDTSNLCYLGVINVNHVDYAVVTNKKTIAMAQSNRGVNMLILLSETEEFIYLLNLREELPMSISNNGLIFHVKGKTLSKYNFPELPHMFCLPEKEGCFEVE